MVIPRSNWTARAILPLPRKTPAFNTSFISAGLPTPNSTSRRTCVRASKQGRVLREGKVPVTEFRAGVIAGSGSISFEMIRFMTELFPIVPGPLWMKNKSQPIAIQNVIDYLFAALKTRTGRGRSSRSADPISPSTGSDAALCPRPRTQTQNVLLPGIPVWFMAFGVGLMTPVPYPHRVCPDRRPVADSIVKHPEALSVSLKLN